MTHIWCILQRRAEMAFFLKNKRVLLGVTGSIAAYKSADLTRRLREAVAVVRVVMTDNAKQFITPLTMQAVSGHPVHDALSCNPRNHCDCASNESRHVAAFVNAIKSSITEEKTYLCHGPLRGQPGL